MSGSNSSNETNPTEERKSTHQELTGLLQPLIKKGCMLQDAGWWTFEFCHNKHIRQYHASAPSAADGKRKIEVEYFLGLADNQSKIELADEPTVVKSQGPERLYLSQNFDNGTICDLT